MKKQECMDTQQTFLASCLNQSRARSDERLVRSTIQYFEIGPSDTEHQKWGWLSIARGRQVVRNDIYMYLRASWAMLEFDCCNIFRTVTFVNLCFDLATTGLGFWRIIRINQFHIYLIPTSLEVLQAATSLNISLQKYLLYSYYKIMFLHKLNPIYAWLLLHLSEIIKETLGD